MKKNFRKAIGLVALIGMALSLGAVVSDPYLREIKKGVPIISAKSRWTLVHAQTAAADNTTALDNASLTDLGSANGVVVIGSFAFDNGTAVLKAYGFASPTDNISAYLGTLTITPDNSSMGGRYVSNEAGWDIKGYRYVKVVIQSFTHSTGDNVTLYAMGY